jgi:Domain of unknown function (DUF4148)
MKTPSMFAAVALAFAGGAFAQDATYPYPQTEASSKTRAEVMAELKQARADGTLQTTEGNWPQVAFVSTKTRADVMAELKQARADGALHTGEGALPQTAFVSTKTREAVRAETMAAIASGEVRALNSDAYAVAGPVPASRADASAVAAAR